MNEKQKNRARKKLKVRPKKSLSTVQQIGLRGQPHKNAKTMKHGPRKSVKTIAKLTNHTEEKEFEDVCCI